MKNRIMAIVSLLILLLVCIDASANSPLDGTERIKTTAYMIDGTTASGQHTRAGICAGPTWMVKDANEQGTWVAMIWTADGTEFLGYFEVLDQGGTDAIQNGHVIDVWFETYDECVEWMETTQGRCLVKYVWAVG